MTTDPKYHAWFELGATKYRGWTIANGEAPPAGDPRYPCPLCQREFTKADLIAGQLTAEDVPPLSVGGKKILLTCQRCNNDQGSRIDSHAEKRERWVDSQTGVRITPFRGEHTVGGLTTRGEGFFGPGQLGFAYVKKMNNPNERQAYEEALRDPANTTFGFTQRPGFSWTQADLSALRAAYLATFALFGWTQIFRPIFDPIRDVLASKITTTSFPAIIGYDTDVTSKENATLLVTEPGPKQGLIAVKMSRSLVVLPGPTDNRTLEDVAAALHVPPKSLDGRQGAEWPTKPKHACDPDPPN
jgi:hypothetical protein